MFPLNKLPRLSYLVFSMHLSHFLPSTLSLQGHWPVMRSHCMSVEPEGSQSHSLQPSGEKP